MRDEGVAAGRALDALVAERVMGWTDIRNDHYVLLDPAGVWMGRAPQSQPWDSPQDKDRGISLVPHYSTDIAAAWLLVECLRDEGWLLSITPDEPGGGWAVQYKPKERNLHGWERADTVPLAICRAALAARKERGDG
jgi:Phage ABA sandwich domain